MQKKFHRLFTNINKKCSVLENGFKITKMWPNEWIGLRSEHPLESKGEQVFL